MRIHTTSARCAPLVVVVALLAVAPAGLAADQQGLSAGEAHIAELAPEAWSQQDPADSIYRAARDAMNRGEHRAAADLFRQIWERHPRSTYAPDAPYWEAFNRYRGGETGDLERALASLSLQEQRWADAATRQSGDADALATRINGMLARRGDLSSAQTVMEFARVASEVGREAAVLGREAASIGRGVAVVARAHRGGDVPPECREQVDLQVAALNALLQMKAETAMPVLARVMERRDECAAPIRRRAVFMVAQKAGPQAVDVLLAAARNDPDMEVRRQAVFWLSEVRDERAVAALSAFALQGGDDQLRERAIFALSQHDDPRARQVLRRIVQDTDSPAHIRTRAVFWLGQEGSAEDVAFLRGLFGRTADATMDERIMFAVSQAGGRENARWLLSVAGSDRVPMDMRKKAVFWAGQAGAPAQEIGALYDRAEDREMKERVLFALSQSSQGEAVEKLIQITRTERDPELRRRAIFWLGNSSDPRAAAALIELLSGPGGTR